MRTRAVSHRRDRPFFVRGGMHHEPFLLTLRPPDDYHTGQGLCPATTHAATRGLLESSTGKEKTMRGWVWTCLAAGLGILIGCGGGKGTATPEAAFEAYKTAVADKDFEGMWGMLSAASRDRMEADAKRIAEQAAKSEGVAKAAAEKQAKLMDLTMDQLKTLQGRGLFIGLLTMAAREGKEEWEKLPRAQLDRVEINVNRANVFVKVGDRVEVDHPLPLVLENGTWKIAMTAAGKSLAP